MNKLSVIKFRRAAAAFGFLSLMLASNAALGQETVIYKANTTTLGNTGDFTTGDAGTGTAVTAPNYTGDVGEFDGSISAANGKALSLGANVTIDGLIFASNLNSYINLTDPTYTLNLGASGIDASVANDGVGINTAIALTANQTWNVGSGTATYAANGATSYQTTTGILYVAGPISGSSSITKTGAGVLNLGSTVSGAPTNSFSGGVTIDAGIVGIENNAAAGTGTVTLGASSGTANTTLEITGSVSTGPTAISVAAGNTGTATLFLYSGNNTLTSAISLANNLTIEGGAGGSTVSGAITGTGNLNITSYSTGGYINLNNGSINTVGSIIFSALNTGGDTIGDTLGANVTGVTDNSSTSVLTISGNNVNYTAGFVINDGTLLDAGAAALGNNDTISIASGAALTVGSNETTTLVNTIADAGTVNLRANLSALDVYTGSGVINIGTTPVSTSSTTGTSPNQTTTVTTTTTSISPTFGTAAAQNVLSGFTGTINVGASATTTKVVATPQGGTATTTSYTYVQNSNKTAITAPTAAGSTVNVADGGTLYVYQQTGVATPLVLAGTINIGGTGNSEGFGALRLDSGTIGSNVVLTDNGTSFVNSAPTGATATTSGTQGSAGGTGVVLGSNGGGTISGVISDGGHGFGIQSAASGGGTITLAGANTYTGATNWTTGTKLDLANALALQSTTLNYTGTGSITFDKLVAGNAFILGGLSGSSNLALQNNASTPVGVAVSVGNDNASTTYTGILSGSGSFTKTGTGTTTLTGNNTYTGGTTVNGGVLSVDNTYSPTSSSGTGTGAVTVNSGGTIGGGSTSANGGVLTSFDSNGATLKTYGAYTTGVISGAVTINSGGALAPGNSVGTLTVGTLTLNSGAVANYEFNGTANDFTFVNSNNGLTLGSSANSVDFNLYQEGTTTAFDTVGVYDLIGFTGSFSGLLSSLTVGNAQSGFNYAFVNDEADGIIQLDITTATSAPEPNSWAMMFLGFGALVMTMRSRRIFKLKA